MTLSVILPNYNHAAYLPEALDAILSQSYPATEIILIDDGSTDQSHAVIQDYCRRFPQIQFHQNEKNVGPVETMNRCVRLSRGKYLVFCAADDCVLPGFFGQLVAFMEQHPEAALCTSHSRYFKNKETFRDDYFPELGSEARVIMPEELVPILNRTAFYIPTQASLYRRDAFLQYGPLANELKMTCDLYLNYRIAFTVPIGFVPQVLASFREQETSYCMSIYSRKKERERVYRILCDKIAEQQKALRHSFRRSAILSVLGIPMLFFLLKTPRFWFLLPPICLKKLKNRSKAFWKKIGL